MTMARGVGMLFCGVPLVLYRLRSVPIAAKWQGSRRALAGWLVLRAVFGFFGIAFQFVALQFMSVGDAAAVVWTAPLFTALLGWLLLGERMSKGQVAAAFAVVIGVLLVCRPSAVTALTSPAAASEDARESSSSGGSSVGVILCLGSAITTAIAIIIIRHLSRFLHWSTLLLAHGTGQALFSPLLSTALGVSLVMPSAQEARLMTAVGLVAFCGQVMMNKGIGLAPSGPTSAMMTSEVLFSFVFQLTLLRTHVHVASAIGASIISGAVAAMLIARSPARARGDDQHSALATSAGAPISTELDGVRLVADGE